MPHLIQIRRVVSDTKHMEGRSDTIFPFCINFIHFAQIMQKEKYSKRCLRSFKTKTNLTFCLGDTEFLFEELVIRQVIEFPVMVIGVFKKSRCWTPLLRHFTPFYTISLNYISVLSFNLHLVLLDNLFFP